MTEYRSRIAMRDSFLASQTLIETGRETPDCAHCSENRVRHSTVNERAKGETSALHLHN